MARAALKLGVRELAEAAKLSRTTITMFENERSEPTPETLATIRAVFERRGIIFVDDDEAPGARLKRRP